MKGKKLLFSLLAAIALVGVMGAPVMAADTGSTEITGTVVKAIEVIVPETVSMGNLDPSLAQPITSGAQTAEVNANHDGWTLAVVEADGSPDGKMALTVTPFTPLTNAMTVEGGDQGTPASLASAVELETSGVGSQTISDIVFKQTVDWADAIGAYAITVTFTATPGT